MLSARAFTEYYALMYYAQFNGQKRMFRNTFVKRKETDKIKRRANRRNCQWVQSSSTRVETLSNRHKATLDKRVLAQKRATNRLLVDPDTVKSTRRWRTLGRINTCGCAMSTVR